MQGVPLGTCASTDTAVQNTNDDATVSKLSCVRKGYFKDDYVHHFVRRQNRRSPVINRGYYARWAAMRQLVDQFLGGGAGARGGAVDGGAEGLKQQILSLGAGYDTLFLQLLDEGKAPHKFFEVDFVEVSAKKAAVMHHHEQLRSKLGPDAEFHIDCGKISSSRYALVGADLRDLRALDAALAAVGFDASLPTLILAECVLIYMDPKQSREVIAWAARKLPLSAFVIYEQINPADAFGQQMVQNLESRGCPLLGLMDTPDLEAKKKRFTDLGYKRAEALDMDVIYNRCLDPVDIKRIERLEIFDEFEEWHIMQEHYCVAFGISETQGLSPDLHFVC